MLSETCSGIILVQHSGKVTQLCTVSTSKRYTRSTERQVPALTVVSMGSGLADPQAFPFHRADIRFSMSSD